MSRAAKRYITRRTEKKTIVAMLSSPDDEPINTDWMRKLSGYGLRQKEKATKSLLETVLPGYPGSGQTPCLTNCKCILKVSEFYVTKFEGAEPREEVLQRDVVREVIAPSLPLAAETEPVRISKEVVKYGGKTYVRTGPGPGGGAFTQTDDVTGKESKLFGRELSQEVSSAYRGEFATTQVTKPKVIPKPKPPPLAPKPKPQERAEIVAKPTPKEKPKLPAPTEEVKKAMEKAKYDEPEEVRKKMLREYQQHDELKVNMREQQDELKKLFPTIKDEYRAAGKTIGEAVKDPRYVEASEKVEALDGQLRRHSKEMKEGMRKLVQTSTEGFQVKTEVLSDVRGFEKRVNDGTTEFSKLIDKDLVQKGFFAPVRARAMGKRYRSNYKASERTMQLAEKDKMKHIVHEMGHVLEGSRPEVGKQARAFRAARTAGEESTTLNGAKETTSYNGSEITKKDKFIDPYMGRIYKGDATEITSMGLELMYEDPYKLAKKDPEMFDFIYRLTRGVPTGFEPRKLVPTPAKVVAKTPTEKMEDVAKTKKVQQEKERLRRKTAQREAEARAVREKAKQAEQTRVKAAQAVKKAEDLETKEKVKTKKIKIGKTEYTQEELDRLAKERKEKAIAYRLQKEAAEKERQKATKTAEVVIKKQEKRETAEQQKITKHLEPKEEPKEAREKVIQKAAKDASGSRNVAKRRATRDRLLRDLGHGDQIKELDDVMNKWIVSIKEEQLEKSSAIISAINNRIDGKPDDFRLNAAQKLHLKGVQFSDKFIDAASVYREFNRQTVSYLQGGGKLSTYRGVSGQYAKDLKKAVKDAKTDVVQVPTRLLASRATKENRAADFARKDGVILEYNLDPKKEIWDSHYTHDLLDEAGEKEIMCTSQQDIIAKVVTKYAETQSSVYW